MKPHFYFRQGEWACDGPVFTGTGRTILDAWRDYQFWESFIGATSQYLRTI